MAKKNELTYLQSPLPEGRKYYKSTKLSFSGLNKRHTLDTGVLSYEKNISTVEAPYLTPSPRPRVIDFHNDATYLTILQMFGFDDFLVVLYKMGDSYSDCKNSNIKIDYVDKEGVFATGELDSTEHIARSVVQFNVYNKNDEGRIDVLTGTYTKKLLIFPDKKSVDFNVERNHKTPTALTPALFDIAPKLKYATVHLSRVFGVDDERVYASAFNDYANWNLDTADEYNESNAWCSPAQSNVRADSNFTGITTYQNHVVCFKRNFMHEIYNTKNPFRIQDLYKIGTIDNRTIQEVNGRLIFVSDDNVMMYTGSMPSSISYNLDISRFRASDKGKSIVSGTDGRNYYLFTMVTNGLYGNFFVYDTLIGEWSERSIDFPVNNEDDTCAWVDITSFAYNSEGMYASADTSDGTRNRIYKLDTTDYSGHSWAFETDLITNNTVDIKHIKKLQMLGDFDNSDLDVYILYDDEKFNAETSHKVYSRTALNGKHPIRVKPRNTAHYGFKLHFEGVGYAKLYELEIFTEQGGDMYV